MTLAEYMKTLSPEQKESYAQRCGTTVAYLFQLSGGHSKASGPLARTLGAQSGGLVQLEALRPDIFGELKSASAGASRSASPA